MQYWEKKEVIFIPDLIFNTYRIKWGENHVSIPILLSFYKLSFNRTDMTNAGTTIFISFAGKINIEITLTIPLHEMTSWWGI